LICPLAESKSGVGRAFRPLDGGNQPHDDMDQIGLKDRLGIIPQQPDAPEQPDGLIRNNPLDVSRLIIDKL
jgi:hypothetical protein